MRSAIRSSNRQFRRPGGRGPRGGRVGGGEDSGFDPGASIPASGRLGQVDELDVEALVSSRWRRRGGRGHRPYSRNVDRPENSRAAPRTTSDRTAVGRRGRSSARVGRLRRARRNLGQQQVDDFLAPVSTAVWARRQQGFRSGEKLGGEVEGGGGGQRGRPRGGFGQAGSPGLAAPPSVRPQSRSRILVAISGSGPRPAQPDGDGHVERPKGEDSAAAAGASGKTEEAKAAALAAAETGSSSPAHAFSPREAVRVRRPGRARRRVEIRPGSRLGGRPASSRHSAESAGRAGRRGEAQIAQRALVRVEAQDLGGCGGALKRKAGAERAGGGRIAAQEGVEEREAGAGEEQGIAVCPAARPRPGGDRRWRRRGVGFRGFRNARLSSRALRSGAATLSPRSAGGSASRFGSARITRLWSVLCGALSLTFEHYPPRLSCGGDVR